MPLGLNRGGPSVRNGFPITLPHEFGTPITLPHEFGNPVTLPKDFGNDVTWTPAPAHFGNIISGAPTVGSLNVTAGTPAGGTAVTITGTNFIAGALVYFGGVLATSIVVVNSTTITVVTPAGLTGAVVDVDVVNVDYQSGTLVNGYTFGTALGIPTFALEAGTTHTPQHVTITFDVNATSTWYTTDGSTPSPTHGTQYTTPFVITTAETIQAMSHGLGAYLDGPVGTVTYAQQATPTFSPVAGSYGINQTVTITGGSNTYWKIGAPPTFGDETTGTSVSVLVSETIYARATAAGKVNSLVGSAAYTITSHIGTLTNFNILAATSITNTGLTTVVGDLGMSPGSTVTGFPPGVVSGTQHITDGAAAQAQLDLTAAMLYYNSLATSGAIAGSNLSTGGNLSANTWGAGVWDGGALTIPTSIVLDAQGDASAVFVFRATSTVNLAGGATISLVNGAQAGNVYWVVGSTLTTVATSTMIGTIMALTTINLGGGIFAGRALASTGAVNIAAATTITFIPQLSTPTFSLSAGLNQTVTVAHDAAATTTYYTTDGSTPDATKTLYATPFSISAAETVKAISFAANYTTSAVGSTPYTKLATPTFAISDAA